MARCALFLLVASSLLFACGGPTDETWDEPADSVGGGWGTLDRFGEATPEQRLIILLLQGRGMALDGFAAHTGGLDDTNAAEIYLDSSPDPMPGKLRDEPIRGSRMN